MVSTGSSPGRHRPPVSAFSWSLPAAAVAVCAAVAVAVVPADARAAVAVCGLASAGAVALVAAEAARRGRAIVALRDHFTQREAALSDRLARQDAVTVRLASEVLPGAVARLQQGEFAEDVLSEADLGDALSPGLRAAHEAVLRSVVKAVDAEEDLRESAQRAFVNIARRVQAIVHQQSSDLREMEDRHGQDPEVFGDLLRLDHGTALIGRLADSIAVLGGARPGRQWSKPVPLFSVLRGAMSRILDYQRVELHSVSELAVVGLAVEPLIHAVAELLDNATRYSPPQTRVHLTAVEVQAGVAVEIEDGGVGLGEEARGRAEQVLQQAQGGIDLNDLGEMPRLGLAVVGRLSQAYRFRVSLRPSAYGGVRAVLIVPEDLITPAPAAGTAQGADAAPRPAGIMDSPLATAVRPATPVPLPPAGDHTDLEDDEVPVVTERTASGLPQRQRRSQAAAAPPGLASAARPVIAPQALPEQDPVQPGVWLADFQNALSGEPPSAAPGTHDNGNTSDKG